MSEKWSMQESDEYPYRRDNLESEFEPLNLDEILGIYKRWYKLGLVTFAGLLFPAVIVIFLIFPLYEANGTVWINRLSPQSEYRLPTNLAPAGSTTFRNLDRQEEIATYAQMVKARSIAETVVDELDITLDSLNTIHDARRYLQAVIYGTIDGVKYIYNSAKYLLGLGTPMGPELEAEMNRVRLIDEFIDRIAVSPVTESNLLNISFRSSDPLLARDATNAILREFTLFSNGIRDMGAMAYFSQSTGELRDELQSSEQELLRLQEVSSNFATGQQRSALIDNLTAAQNRLRAISVEQSKLTSQATAYRARLEEEPDKILVQEQGVGNSRQGIIWEVNPVHQELKMRLINTEVELTSLKDEAMGYQNLVDEIQNELNDLGNYDLLIREQEREIDLLEESYQINLRNLAGANSSQAMSGASLSAVRPVSSAPLPIKPVRPRKLVYLLIAFAGSLIVGMAMPFLAYLNDSTIANVKDLKEHLGLQFVTVFPDFDKYTEKRAWYVPKFR